MLEETNDKLKCINLQMLRTSHWVLKTYDDAYRPFGIRATQLPVLSMIAESGPVTIKLIAAEILSERSVLSRKLQVMEKNGWIRQVLIDSSREKAFELTQQGRELLDRVKPVRWQVQESILGKLDESEQDLMLGLCDKLRS